MQNIENEQWDLEEVNAKLQRKMERATDGVIDEQARIKSSLESLEAARGARGLDADGPEPLDPVDLRTAAYVLAIRRVGEVTFLRGIWP